MKEYRVTWAVDVSAENPREAALEAERIQLAQCLQDGSLPGAFVVREEDADESTAVLVNLAFGD